MYNTPVYAYTCSTSTRCSRRKTNRDYYAYNIPGYRVRHETKNMMNNREKTDTRGMLRGIRVDTVYRVNQLYVDGTGI